jgi:thioredoxin
MKIHNTLIKTDYKMMRNISINLLSAIGGLLLITFSACNLSTKEREDIPEINQEMEPALVSTETAVSVTEEEEFISSLTISSEQFIKLVSDYRKEWKYKGKKPCVVDFYADWCRPCKLMEPTFEKMAKQYAGEVDFYKVDVDSNEEIVNAFHLMGIPTLFFCSSNGELIRVAGYQSEEQLIANIVQIISK